MANSGAARHTSYKWWDGGGDALSQIICACGWESATYFEGRPFAQSEWRQHVKDEVAKTRKIDRHI